LVINSTLAKVLIISGQEVITAVLLGMFHKNKSRDIFEQQGKNVFESDIYGCPAELKG